MNQQEFFQQHAVDGNLPDHLMTQMLALPEGDISFIALEAPKEGSASPGAADPAVVAAPAPAPAPAVAPAPPAPAPAPVVVAKDGVHTIPYERLEEARTAAQQEKARADALAAEIERLRIAATAAPAPSPAPAAPAPAPAPESVAGMFGDYSDAAIAAGVEKLIAARTGALEAELATMRQQLTPVQEAAELAASRAHWTTIYGAHPDLDSMVESAELKTWIEKQPAFLQAAYNATLDTGSAKDVVDLFNAYKQATGRTTAAAPGAAPAAPSSAAQAAAAAAAAIAGARAPVPTSLSELPAGTAAHHDENAAMLELSPTAVLTRLEGLSPAQIEERLSKLL